MKNRSEVMDASKITTTVEVGDQTSAECITTGRPLEEEPLVGTLPQEHSSLELADEPAMVQKKKRSSGARRKQRMYLRKQEKASAAQQADEGPGARGTLGGESGTGTDVDTGSGSRTKRLLEQEAIAAQQADKGLEARGALGGESSTGSDVDTGGSSRTKRPLSPGGTPQGAQSQVKRKKQSYKDALDVRLQVFVVYKDDPSRQLTAEEATYLRQENVKLIDEEPDSSTSPRFNESGLVQGALRVTCADQCSMDWLLEKEESIPARASCAFIVMKATDRPKQVKVRVWIPEPKVVLARLAKQNPSLKTDEWHLIHREAKDTGQLLVLGINLASLKALKELEGRPYLELSLVNFILPDSKSE